MILISIDGACRRNGKPNCLSAGGLFIAEYDDEFNLTKTSIQTTYELNSTNQRGEMMALKLALHHCYSHKQSAQIVTDSEYLFNTITKEWVTNWANKGWVTAAGEPVKNKDLWIGINAYHQECIKDNLEIVFYHIKGHTLPFGKVTGQSLLAKDLSGYSLFEAVSTKYDDVGLKSEIRQNALELSKKNNGFSLDEDVLKRFVVTNAVADAVATRCVEAADSMLS